MANSKRTLFLKRRLRVRNKLRKVNAGRPRLSVHRSNKNISAQLIDDVNGVTLASASTLEKDLGVVGKNNIEAAIKANAEINGGSYSVTDNLEDACANADVVYAKNHVCLDLLPPVQQTPQNDEMAKLFGKYRNWI